MRASESSPKALVAFLLLVTLFSAVFIGAVLAWGDKGYYWAAPYMFTPAIAAIITRCFFHKHGFKDAKLRFGKLSDYLRYWAVPIAITLLCYLLYTLTGAVRWDFSGETFLQTMSEQMAAAGQDINDLPEGLTPKTMLLLFSIGGLTVFNIPGILQGFGEEFGWRGLMLPEFYKRMGKPAFIVCGIIWFLWHVPLMFVFPQTQGFTILGQVVNSLILAAGCIFTFVFFAYIYVKTQSIWVVSFSHITFNNAARSFSYFVVIENQLLANLVLTITMASVVIILYKQKKLEVFKGLRDWL